jgi:hypothetical protein
MELQQGFEDIQGILCSLWGLHFMADCSERH